MQHNFPLSHTYNDHLDDSTLNTTSTSTPKESFEISNPPTPTPSKRPRSCIYITALIFSIFCTFSVFEVNMQSSRIASDLFVSPTKPPAKRAVLFISDGTKADSMFGLYPDKRPVAPFLRSIIEEQGSFGVSYTALPTESKICTTTMLSGYYLDLPDLVNLYFFGRALSDHVLNQSNYAWSFGSPEIIHLFSSTGDDDRDTVTITPVDDNLNNSYKCPQNYRVIEQVEELFQNAQNESELDKKLRSDKVVILVHLICTDLFGHIYKPYSSNYFEQITLTDGLIKQASEKISSFYNDDKTAFFVTADHGMKDTGVHADDSLENVRTPFIAWGAGLSGPKIEADSSKSHDGYSMPWDLMAYERKDIRQVDIAPLISSVIGTPIPSNSEGMVPLKYLEEKPWFRAEKIFMNAKQICSSFVKREDSWMRNSILSIFTKAMSPHISIELNEIHGKINEKNYEFAEKQSHKLIDKCLKGIESYKDSEKSALLIIFGLSFLGWMTYGFIIAIVIPSTHGKLHEYTSTYPKIIWASLSALLLLYLWLKNSPWRYYVYSILPIFFSYQAALYSLRIKEVVKRVRLQTIFWVLLLIGSTQLLSIAFKGQKELLMYAIIIWGFVIALENYSGKKQLLFWMISVSSLAWILSFQKIEVPVVSIFIYGWIALTVIGFSGALYFRKEAFKPLLILAFLTLGSGYLSLRADFPTDEERKNYLSFWHDLAKISLPVALVYPFIFKAKYNPSLPLFLYLIFACFSPLLILQSISYECLFYIAFVLTLSSWMIMEKSKNKLAKNASQRNAVLILLGFHILYHISYYGIGNHATIDSFKLEAGFRLLDGFNVPRLGLLMILKFSIPFFILSVFFQAMIRQNYPGKNSLHAILFAVSTCGAIIFNYFDTRQEDIYHPKLTISYPILTASILTANVAVSGFAYLLLDKMEIEYADQIQLLSKI